MTGTLARRPSRKPCRATASSPAAPARGAEAMSLSAAIPFDLIVLSLSLIEEDPLKLASSLRAADATHEIPMLLVAEPEERESILRGFDLGANDWLVLPLDENELRARARNQIRRKFYQDRLRTDLGTALEMALIDPLTGLYNQRYLMRHLRGLLESGPEPRTRCADDRCRPLQVGQRRIRPCHRRQGAARHRRCAARQHPGVRFARPLWRRGVRGGDAGHRRSTMPSQAAERLRARGRGDAFAWEPGSSARLTVSIGVACSGAAADDAGSAAACRRRALYDGQTGGRNRIEIAAPPEPDG